MPRARGCVARGSGGGEAAASRPRRSRRRGSTSGRTTTAAGRRRTRPGGSTSRRCSAARCRRPTRRTSRQRPQVPQVVDEPRPRRQQDDLRDLVRLLEPASTAALRRSTRTSSSSMATGNIRSSRTMAEYFGAGEDAIYLSGMAAGAATKTGVVGYIVPFGDPGGRSGTRTRSRSASQATHPGAKVKLIWTNSWFARRRRRGRAEALVAAGADVLGQNVDSPAAGSYAESKGIPWVGLRLGREEVRAEAVADRLGLQLGRLLRAAGQGGDERHVEVRASTTADQGRVHQAGRQFGPKVTAADEGADRDEGPEADVAGKFNEFAGPLYDQSGKLRVPKGKRPERSARPVLDAVAGQGRGRERPEG